MSSVVGNEEENVTVWKWYWKKSSAEWIMYDKTVLLLLFFYLSGLLFLCSQMKSSLKSFLDIRLLLGYK